MQETFVSEDKQFSVQGLSVPGITAGMFVLHVGPFPAQVTIQIESLAQLRGLIDILQEAHDLFHCEWKDSLNENQIHPNT